MVRNCRFNFGITREDEDDDEIVASFSRIDNECNVEEEEEEGKRFASHKSSSEG